jgi:hypothetical protein
MIKGLLFFYYTRLHSIIQELRGKPISFFDIVLVSFLPAAGANSKTVCFLRILYHNCKPHKAVCPPQRGGDRHQGRPGCGVTSATPRCARHTRLRRAQTVKLLAFCGYYTIKTRMQWKFPLHTRFGFIPKTDS